MPSCYLNDLWGGLSSNDLWGDLWTCGDKLPQRSEAQRPSQGGPINAKKEYI